MIMKITGMTDDFPPALYELLAGIAAYGVIAEVIVLALTADRLHATAGLWLGIAVACCMAVHMAWALDIGLSPFVANAPGYIRKHAVLRYLAVVVSYVLITAGGIGHPVSCFAGIMGLKAGAYLQPLTHKAFEKIRKKQSGGFKK